MHHSVMDHAAAIDRCRERCGGVTRRRCLIICTILCFFIMYVIIQLVNILPGSYIYGECYASQESVDKMEKLLEIIVKVAKEEDVIVWLDYGTLLGAVRDQTIIPWDKDVDLGCYEADLPRIQSPSFTEKLKQQGIIRHGSKEFIFREDLKQFMIDQEQVFAKLELYPVVDVDGPAVNEPNGTTWLVRRDLIPLFKSDKMADKIWLKALHVTAVVIHNKVDVFPLRTVAMEHLDMSEFKRQHKEQGKPHEYKIRDASRWSASMPAPRDSRWYLETIYGKSWSHPIKWKVSCFV